MLIASDRFKIKHEGPEEYANMWQKSRAIWKYVNFHYNDDFDWFVLGGDDLFVIVENLRKVCWNGFVRSDTEFVPVRKKVLCFGFRRWYQSASHHLDFLHTDGRYEGLPFGFVTIRRGTFFRPVVEIGKPFPVE